MADVAHEENVIEGEERAFIHSIIDFGDTVAREVMVPRPDMVTVEADTSVTGALETALAAGFSRIPVHTGQIDDVEGIAYTKDLMRAERVGRGEEPVRASARPAVFVPESKEVPSLLRQMQEEKFHMAIVVDEYGGTAGLVTLEDLLEELVGEIVDEFDVEEPSVEQQSRRVGGGQRPLRRGRRRRAARAPSCPRGPGTPWAASCSTWSAGCPTPGDSVEVDGFRLTALEVRGRRIGRVRIEPMAVVTSGDGHDGQADDGGRLRSPCAPASSPSSAVPTWASRPW